MTVFKNKAYTGRDHDCTNIVLCVADEPPSENWQRMPADSHLAETYRGRFTHLYTQGNAAYWGYL